MLVGLSATCRSVDFIYLNIARIIYRIPITHRYRSQNIMIIELTLSYFIFFLMPNPGLLLRLSEFNKLRFREAINSRFPKERKKMLITILSNNLGF